MTNEITYTVAKITAGHADLLRDLNTQGKSWMIIRTSPISMKAWGFYNTEALAKAAARRWRSRDVVTR